MSISAAVSNQYNRAANINALAQILQLSALGQLPDVIGVLAVNAANRTQNNDFDIVVNALKQIENIPADLVTVQQIQAFVKLILLRTVGV